MGKKKINKKRFISRIFIIIVFFIIVILAVSSKSYTNISKEGKLIVDMQDITDKLAYDIYIDKDSILYLSIEDIKNIFDKNLYYEEATGKILTTSETKTAAININNNEIQVNSAKQTLVPGIIKYSDIIYIPISEITNIYNIEVRVSGNSAIILSLYKELNTVNTNKKISLKEKPESFSKTIQKLENGQELLFISESDKKDFIKVLTYDGNIGYIREKDVNEKKQVRIDMKESDFTSKEPDLNNSIKLDMKKIQIDELKDFDSRKKVIEDIISTIISKDKYTVVIEKNGIENNLLERFIIELEPRLKEIGGSVVREDIKNE